MNILLKKMFSQKVKENGQAIVGGILGIVLLIALVVFIFFLIRRPEGPPPSPPEFTGLSQEALAEIKEEAAETEKNFPVAQILPYGGPFDNEPFFIHGPTKEGIILIEIDAAADEEEAKNEAMDWIRYQGYNPEDYELTFRTKTFPR